jgi:hypothetical protein
MANVTMYDATDAGLIPLDSANMPTPGTVAVASYCDADFATGWIDCIHKYPTLAALGWVVSIASRTSTIARVLDIEPGNPATPGQAPGWVKAMISHGVFLPTIYADESEMPSIMAALEASGLHRSQYGLWLANPTGKLHTVPGFEATQSEFDKAFDVSDCLPSFLPAIPAEHPSARAHGIANFEGSFNLDTGVMTVKGTPGKVTWGTESMQWEQKVSLGNTDGRWQASPLPFGK